MLKALLTQKMQLRAKKQLYFDKMEYVLIISGLQMREHHRHHSRFVTSIVFHRYLGDVAMLLGSSSTAISPGLHLQKSGIAAQYGSKSIVVEA